MMTSSRDEKLMQYLSTFNSLDSLDSCVALHKGDAKKERFKGCECLIYNKFTGVQSTNRFVGVVN